MILMRIISRRQRLIGEEKAFFAKRMNYETNYRQCRMRSTERSISPFVYHAMGLLNLIIINGLKVL
jgi:hypothetical protein